MNDHPTYVQSQPAHASKPAGHDAHDPAKSAPRQPQFVVTPAKLKDALIHRWRLALLVGVIFAACGVAIAVATYKPKYTATTQVRITSSKQSLLPGDEMARSAREEEFQKTQVQLIKDRMLLKEVLSDGKIRPLALVKSQDDPVVWLQKDLQASFISGTDIFRLWLTADSAGEITDIVNAVMEAYLKQHAKVLYAEQFGKMEDISKVITTADARVKSLREIIANHHKATQFQRSNVELLEKLKRDKTELEGQKRRFEAERSVNERALKDLGSKPEVPKEMIKEFVDAHPAVQKDRTEVDRLEAQIKELRKTLNPDSPRLKQTINDLETARATLEKTRKATEPEVEAKARTALSSQYESASTQTNKKLVVVQEELNQVEKQMVLTREAAGAGIADPESTRGELAEAEGVLRKLRAEKERLEIENLAKARVNKESIEVDLRRNLTPAETPTLNQASLYKNGSIYGLLGLALGLFAVSYFEARFHRVHKSASILKELGIQTLGVLPLLARKRAGAYGAELTNDSMPGILFTDAVNGICTRLLCDDRLNKKSILMITSANENEGKTTVATQVAMGMARAGRKTLLLDCDFRNPSCHTHLGLGLTPGISELFFGEVELKDIFQDIPDSEAKLLSAGEVSPQVAKALNDGRLAALLLRLRKDFDCIIIDSAPTPIVADGLLIGKLVDGVIVVVRAKVTKGPSVVAALDQLTMLKIPALGAVVNANPGSMSSYYL